MSIFKPQDHHPNSCTFALAARITANGRYLCITLHSLLSMMIIFWENAESHDSLSMGRVKRGEITKMISYCTAALLLLHLPELSQVSNCNDFTKDNNTITWQWLPKTIFPAIAPKNGWPLNWHWKHQNQTSKPTKVSLSDLTQENQHWQSHQHINSTAIRMWELISTV